MGLSNVSYRRRFPYVINDNVFLTVCPGGITNLTGSSGTITHYDYGVNETKCWRIEVPDAYDEIDWTYGL